MTAAQLLTPLPLLIFGGSAIYSRAISFLLEENSGWMASPSCTLNIKMLAFSPMKSY